MEVQIMNNLSYADALIKARRYEALAEQDSYVAEGAKEMFEKVSNSVKDANNKAKEAIGNIHIKDKALGAVEAIKKHPGKTAAAVAGTAAAIGAGVAAKKIYDKKKAAKQNHKDVKENYEYDEYSTVVEAVISGLMSDDEIVSENASEIAMATADYLIDHINEL